jgi:hypothetical protein
MFLFRPRNIWTKSNVLVSIIWNIWTKYERFCFDMEKFELNLNVFVSLKKFLRRTETFSFRFVFKLRYRNVLAFVSISLTLLVQCITKFPSHSTSDHCLRIYYRCSQFELPLNHLGLPLSHLRLPSDHLGLLLSHPGLLLSHLGLLLRHLGLQLNISSHH